MNTRGKKRVTLQVIKMLGKTTPGRPMTISQRDSQRQAQSLLKYFKEAVSPERESCIDKRVKDDLVSYDVVHI